MTARSELDDVVADPLVFGVVSGDRAAWFQLTIEIERWVETHVPSHWRMRKARLHGSRDDVRDVLLGVLERIDRDDFRALRTYLEQKLAQVPDVRRAVDSGQAIASFAGFLRAVVDFAVRDHVRQRYGRAPRGAGVRRAPGGEHEALTLTRRDLHSWAVHPSASRSSPFAGSRPAISGVLTARSILAYAAEVFAPEELSLFRRYLEQASLDELAEEFALADAAAARATVRRLKERLRARFRDDP